MPPPTVLSPPAGLSGAIGDGVANDTAAVQRLFNSGLPCFDLGPYTYAVTSITIPSTVRHIRGWGESTSRFIAHPSKLNDSSPLIAVKGASGIVLENLTINLDKTSWPSAPALTLTNCSRARVQNITTGGGFPGVLATSCPDITIQNCTVSSFASFGISVMSSPRARVLLNTVTGPGTGDNIRIGLSPNSKVINNTSLLNGTFGIAIHASNNCHVMGNYCATGTIEGIVFGIEGGGGVQGGIIANNIIECLPGHHDLGMSFGFAGHSIQNIIITGNYIQSPWLAGIALSGDNKFFQVHGNTILGANQMNDTQWNCSIAVMGSSATSFNSIYGNTFVTATGHAAWGTKEFNGWGAGNPNNNIFGPDYGQMPPSGWSVALTSATKCYPLA